VLAQAIVFLRLFLEEPGAQTKPLAVSVYAARIRED
jgi:hypothetical protein